MAAAVPAVAPNFGKRATGAFDGTPPPSRAALAACGFCIAQSSRLRSESAPVWRYSVIAMQLGFLRAVAPVEILVGAERRRTPEFFVVDVEFVGLEPRIVAKARPRQRQQVGAHA